MKPLFFNPADLNQLQEVAGKTFKKDNTEHQQIERNLKAGVWEKTAHWLNQLAEQTAPVFESRITRSVRQQAGTTLNAAGEKKMKLRFKPFTWGRLFRHDQEDTKIFFTVGVDATQKVPSLVWKLDCLQAGSSPLPAPLIERFKEFIRLRGAHVSWQSIPLAEVEQWDWERLAAVTQQFILDNLTTYDEAVDYVWQGRTPGIHKLARICWNTKGWERPSGQAGKSKTGGLYEGEDRAGYGVEEWLFDYTRILKGYHYAFLQPLNVASDIHERNTYNIRLYTRNADTGEHFYVGRIKHAEVLTVAEIQAATAAYERKGWLAEMTEELRTVGANGALDDSMFQFGPFNLRFRPEDVERPDTDDGLLLIPDFSEWSESHRYVLLDDVAPELDYIPSWDKAAQEPTISFATGSKGNTGRHREIAARTIELRAVHEKLQKQLIKDLQLEFPNDHIGKEGLIKPFRVSVDVVRQPTLGGKVFYEIKALPTLKACLREAIGQLLEYACWPTHMLAAEWVIVSYHSPTDASEVYLQNLRKRFNLPISYRQVKLR